MGFCPMETGKGKGYNAGMRYTALLSSMRGGLALNLGTLLLVATLLLGTVREVAGEAGRHRPRPEKAGGAAERGNEVAADPRIAVETGLMASSATFSAPGAVGAVPAPLIHQATGAPAFHEVRVDRLLLRLFPFSNGPPAHLTR